MSECIWSLDLRDGMSCRLGVGAGYWQSVSTANTRKLSVCRGKSKTNSSNNNEDNKNRNLNAFCCLGKNKNFCASLFVYTFMYIYIYIYGKTYIYTYIYITTLVLKEIERNVHKKDNENIAHVFSKERQSKKFYRW